jgi:hypothetical protein
VARQQLHAVRGQASGFQRVAQHGDERGVRVLGGRRPAQQRGVAGLQREARRVDGHVRPGFVDHADDAERDAHLAHVQPVGEQTAAQHLAHRVGQARDRQQTLGDAVDPLLGERQAVEHVLGEARFAPGFQVGGVRLEDLLGPFTQGGGHLAQRRVLAFAGRQDEFLGGDTGSAGGGVHLFAQFSGHEVQLRTNRTLVAYGYPGC